MKSFDGYVLVSQIISQYEGSLSYAQHNVLNSWHVGRKTVTLDRPCLKFSIVSKRFFFEIQFVHFLDKTCNPWPFSSLSSYPTLK